MKLYKYRPLSEFLFKELYYQEIYFASYNELNDPLDLKAKIDFTTNDIKQISNLLKVMFKTSFKMNFESISHSEEENNKSLYKFNTNNVSKNKLQKEIFKQLQEIKTPNEIITIYELEQVLKSTTSSLNFEFDIENFKKEINRLTIKFLANSYTTCFSENNDNPLMWSHYASKHSGICIEFSLPSEGLFPYRMIGKRETNEEKYKSKASEWSVKELVYSGRLKKVTYEEEQPYINFFDFFPVFDNEYDCDLIGLSKSWTHGFAYELENIFSIKTNPWKYENEWRAIEINFGDSKEPEDRIRHYPIECLSAIYFGCNTPENVKNRIYKIFNRWSKTIQFYDCEIVSGKLMEFREWQHLDE
ncbi:MAG: DUF2971 domain-containing protein [Bacteroidota bacterium]